MGRKDGAEEEGEGEKGARGEHGECVFYAESNVDWSGIGKIRIRIYRCLCINDAAPHSALSVMLSKQKRKQRRHTKTK